MGRIGQIPWNKGLKGAQTHSQEVRQRISQTNKKVGVGKWMKGRPYPETSKEKQRIKMTGLKRPWVKGWPKGKPRSEETKKKLSGANNHWWKGGITPLVKHIRYSFEYRQWRCDIFQRDDYTCQKCSKRGNIIHADHYPKSFSDIFADNSIKTMEDAKNCQEFWNINNGRTLCKPCHKETDTWGVKRKKI